MKKVYSPVISVLIRIAVLSTFCLLVGLSGCFPTPARPMVFVHGFAGSADQFETQAMRFASNGYPADYISGYEYDTTSVSGNPSDGFVVPPEVISGLDAHIDAVREQTGADKVDLLGHSMGTAVSHAYLADPARAAKIAHYVNLDGMQSAAPPGGIPTLAIWADSVGAGREIGGAINITLADTTHVQAATCVESFSAIYKFFHNNEAPLTTDIAPEHILPRRPHFIELSGRVVTFLTNAVPADLKLDAYEVDQKTGGRIRSTPDYSTVINAGGNFTFARALAGRSYEFYITSPSNETFGHYYYEPFVRSDRLIRLKYIAPSIVGSLMDQSAAQSNLIIIRNKEFLGVNALYPNEDSLKVNDTELCAGILTANGILGTPIALFVFDKGSDRANDLSGPIQSGLVASIPFIFGLDFYLQAAPPERPISIVLKGRSAKKTQVVNVPNWPSTQNKITVQLWDY